MNIVCMYTKLVNTLTEPNHGYFYGTHEQSITEADISLARGRVCISDVAKCLP